MRIKYPLVIFLLLAALYADQASAQAQLPPTQWALQYGGGNVDIPYVIKFTSDGEPLLPVIRIQEPVMSARNPTVITGICGFLNWISAERFNGKDQLAEPVMKVQEI